MTDEEFAKLKYLHKEAKKRGLKIVKNKKIANGYYYYVADTMTNSVVFGGVNGTTLEDIEDYLDSLEEEYDDQDAEEEEEE